MSFDAAAFLESRDFLIDKDKDLCAREFNPREYESSHRFCDYFPRSPYPLPGQFRPSPSLSATLDVPSSATKPKPTEFVAAYANSMCYDVMNAYVRFQTRVASREESLEAMDALLKLSKEAQVSENPHFPNVHPLSVFKPAYECNNAVLSAMREILDSTDEIPEFDAENVAEKEIEVKEPNPFDVRKLAGDGEPRNPLREMLAALGRLH